MAVIKVGMADYNTCRPPDILTTLGLGSCVGIVLYDPVTKVSGLAHIMLPDSKQIENSTNRRKFADTSIDMLIEEMVKKGANKRRLISKLAGGAQMFKFENGNALLRIGERNIIATKEKLIQLSIPIVSLDCGKNYGRTIEFNPENGELKIKSIVSGIIFI